MDERSLAFLELLSIAKSTFITFLNRLPRTYQYCTPCAGHLGVWPVARPWVEVINNVQGPANMNRNLVTLPAPAQATFQRLGMQTGQPSGNQVSVPCGY